MNNVKENVVIITGGSGLLGKAFSLACADKRYSVIIADINDEIGTKTASEIARRTILAALIVVVQCKGRSVHRGARTFPFRIAFGAKKRETTKLETLPDFKG